MISKALKQRIQRLRLSQKQELQAWLIEEIQRELAEQESHPPAHKNRELVKRQQAGAITYQLELVKCGKEGCKCNRGELHGPYWYAYQRQGNKFKSTYIGKHFSFPPEEKL